MARLWDISDDISCFEILVGQSSDFEHRFGGKPSHSGITPKRADRPVHLVMTFDLTDPRIPFRQPGLTRLPLLYPFQYDGGNLLYRVVDDDTVEIVRPPVRDFTSDFPFDGYPQLFDRLPLSLSERIGIDSYFEDDFVRERWHEDVEQAAKEAQELDEVDRISVVEGLMQGPPRSVCINPGCSRQKMTLLTVLRGDVIDGMHLWANNDYGPEVDITYEYCPTCFLMYTENQCD